MTVIRGGTLAARRAFLRKAYAAYNEQDADALVQLVREDVDWPDGGVGRLHGRAAVRAYWLDQWTRTRTHDEPLEFAETPDGRIAVRIDQVMRAVDGSVISTGQFIHRLRFDGELIARLDIEPA